MPAKTTAQTAVGIVYSVFKLAYFGLQSRAAFEIQALYNDVARTFSVSEEHIGRGGDDAAVMLSYYMSNYRKMRGIVESDSVFAVMYVKIIGNDVLAQNESVLESLSGDVADDVIVVLIARHHKSYGMAGIFLQFLFEQGVTNGFVEAELTVADPYAGNVLKVCSALRGVHFVLVQMNAELKICH